MSELLVHELREATAVQLKGALERLDRANETSDDRKALGNIILAVGNIVEALEHIHERVTLIEKGQTEQPQQKADPDRCDDCGHEPVGGKLRPEGARNCPCWCHFGEGRLDGLPF